MSNNRTVTMVVSVLAIHACSPNRADVQGVQQVTRNDSLQALVAAQEIYGDINESVFHFVITCATSVDDGAVLTVDTAVLPSVADSLAALGRELTTVDPLPPMTMAILVKGNPCISPWYGRWEMTRRRQLTLWREPRRYHRLIRSLRRPSVLVGWTVRLRLRAPSRRWRGLPRYPTA